MRLLYFTESGELGWTVLSRDTIPPYAILSHTWDSGEVSFEDLVNDAGKKMVGYRKILFCGNQAALDDLKILLGGHVLHRETKLDRALESN